MDGLSALIPAYNEAEGIRAVIEEVRAALSHGVQQSELIVVDDGSTDGTGDRAREAGVKVITHEVNRGYGAAIQSGMEQAAYDMILIMDADGTYPAEKIPDLLQACESHDMVVGARTAEEVHIPFCRRPMKWFLNKLANYLAGRRIPDLNSGMRIFRKEIARRFSYFLPPGFSFTSTLTLAMLCNGYRVAYVPINYRKRSGVSKIRPIADTMNFLQLIVRTALYFNPLKVFLPLGFIMVGIAFFLLVYSYCFMPRVMDVTVVVIFMAAINVFTIGMLADLIDKRLQG